MGVGRSVTGTPDRVGTTDGRSVEDGDSPVSVVVLSPHGEEKSLSHSITSL